MVSKINCHSAFKHYEMFHSDRGGGNYGSIFNNTYNVNCGGHGGGFWGGLGFGFGNALAGMFGGMFGGGFGMGNMLGGFGNMFGGFGMGNMFGGFGMPSFGNMFGSWDWGTKKKNDNDTEKNDDKAELNHNDNKECTNKDVAKIDGYHKQADRLDKTPDAKQLKALYDKVVNSKANHEDEKHEADDNIGYDAVLRRLQLIADKNGWGDLSSKDFGLDKEPTPPAKAANVIEKQDTKPNPTQNDKDSVTIDGKNVKLSDLTPEQIKNLTNEQIKGLDPNQATALLKTLGIEEGGIAKNTNVRQVLLLLQNSGIVVKLAENTNSSVNDNWIMGKISNVSEDGNLSYDVDCNNENSTQKNKYHFADKDGQRKNFVVTVSEFGTVDNQNATYKDENVKSVEYIYSENEYLQREGNAFTTLEEIKEE